MIKKIIYIIKKLIIWLKLSYKLFINSFINFILHKNFENYIII